MASLLVKDLMVRHPLAIQQGTELTSVVATLLQSRYSATPSTPGRSTPSTRSTPAPSHGSTPGRSSPGRGPPPAPNDRPPDCPKSDTSLEPAPLAAEAPSDAARTSEESGHHSGRSA